MAYFLLSKKLRLSSGAGPEVILHEKDATSFGVRAGDTIQLSWDHRKMFAIADVTLSEVTPGSIGLFEEVWRKIPVSNASEPIEVAVLGRPPSVQAIVKKLLGGALSYEEISSIIEDIVTGRIGPIEITYFVASGFSHSPTNEELYSLVKAIAETGEVLKFPSNKIVVDKHSVGGLAGNRTTMIVVPIIASLGLTIPKTSSRAITSPAGTADTMELLAPVTLGVKKMKEVIRKTGGCIVWGGGINFAPADDVIIHVSRPLAIEPYDKMIVSILAKKVAEGVKFLIIDMPYGPTTKIPSLRIARELEKKFMYLGKRFGMKVEVIPSEAREPMGRGVGPALEARDVLRVLQQKDKRPPDLQKKAVRLAGRLLELCGGARKGQGEAIALRQLENGAAWKKMQQMITAQGGHPHIDSDDLTKGALTFRMFAKKGGRISGVDNQAITEIARTLGAPSEKLAGIHVHARFGQRVSKGVQLYTLYAASRDRLELAKKAALKREVFTIR